MFYATYMRLFSLPCLFCDFLNDLKSLYRFLLLDVFERCLHSELVHMTIIVLLVLVCENQFEFLVTNVGGGRKNILMLLFPNYGNIIINFPVIPSSVIFYTVFGLNVFFYRKIDE